MRFLRGILRNAGTVLGCVALIASVVILAASASASAWAYSLFAGVRWNYGSVREADGRARGVMINLKGGRIGFLDQIYEEKYFGDMARTATSHFTKLAADRDYSWTYAFTVPMKPITSTHMGDPVVLKGFNLLGLRCVWIGTRPFALYERDASGKFPRSTDKTPSATEQATGFASQGVEGDIPLWMIMAASSVMPLIVFRGWLKRRRRIRRDCCAKCGYNLQAHSPGEKCPECGTVIPQPKANAARKVSVS